jgi:hypothetical protein
VHALLSLIETLKDHILLSVLYTVWTYVPVASAAASVSQYQVTVAITEDRGKELFPKQHTADNSVMTVPL